MTTFESLHQDHIAGKLVGLDRVIFKGHLQGLLIPGNMEIFLCSQKVLMKNFGRYALRTSESLKAHGQKLARKADRPYEYLASAMTASRGNSKEERARQIAKRDNVQEGLVAVFATVEPCMTFRLRPNHATRRLEVVAARRKCLHLYFYLLDRHFGLMHVRLQTWFPFTVQVYINGREALCRQLEERGVSYERYDNAVITVADLPLAQQLADRLARRNWIRVLSLFARRFNPMLKTIESSGFGSYYWVTDQCELATDVLFRDRTYLAGLMPDLFEGGILAFSVQDALRFMGRKPNHPHFTGEVTADLRRRPEGCRLKHRLRRNSIKLYDKWSALRVETTINNPREFNVLRYFQRGHKRVRSWTPMAKGVTHLWRYLQVARAANERYLDALGTIAPKGEAVRALDRLCQPRTVRGRHVPRLQPIGPSGCQLFQAALAGEHAINGFRNRDLQKLLYPRPPANPADAKRRCARVSRLIARLRGHGLVAKVPSKRLYRPTPAGSRLMVAAIRVRLRDLPDQLRATG